MTRRPADNRILILLGGVIGFAGIFRAEASMDTIPWTGYSGRWMFEVNGKGPLRKGVEFLVFPLTEAKSIRQWDAAYGPEPRHPALMLDHARFSGHVRLPANWESFWEHDEAAFASLLAEWVSLEPDTPVLFHWMRESCAATTWKGFLLFWDAFLYDDEYPLLHVQNKGTADQPFDIMFCPHGEVLMPPLPGILARLRSLPSRG